LIQFDTALKTVMDSVRTSGSEKINMRRAQGRILAEDIRMDMDMPPHNMSAMDGFAIKTQDMDGPLIIVDEIAAGSMPSCAIRSGQCSRIMTGAPVPRGADAVVMVEHISEKDGIVNIIQKSDNPNIRYKGEDLKKGDVVLRRGTLVTPSEIAVLASAGHRDVNVSKIPVVGIIATGNELVEPGRKVSGAQIRNSNGWQLTAQTRRAGCEARYFGIAKDTPFAISAKIRSALAKCDIVILSGGVSAGNFDFVPDVMRKIGVRLLFEKIAIKPGKPTVFGVKGKKYFFGLPGNPVSTYVLFEMLVRPFLMRLMGNSGEKRVLKARLGEEIKRKNTDRMEFRPVKIEADGMVYGINYHGSAHIHAYTAAHGMVVIPAGVGKLHIGDDINIILL
jgi:molybdopterin molybdotransferase